MSNEAKSAVTPHWSLRRGGQWNTFDVNPRISYYKFLRAVYGMTAQEAFSRL